MERRGYALKVAYDGRAFHGWQRQPGLRTVQQTIENGLASLGIDARLAAAARTDRGVSARAQVVSFRVRQAPDAAEMLPALQAAMPSSVRLLAWAEVGESFHARASAKSREYRYRVPPGFDDLDLEAASRFLSSLLGERDRRPYVWRPTRSLTSNLTIAEIVEREGGGLELRFVADRYGRRLVRNWVHVTLAAARGEHCDHATEQGWRGLTAPAQGLVLWDVKYAESPFQPRAEGFGLVNAQNLT
jgi:tRNA pseudouridine38-40 synthase